MKFNEKLIKLRKEKGLSQEELGYELNVTRQTVSKWELGQTTPEMDKLLEMSKLFGVSLDELTGDSDISSNYSGEENNSKKKNIVIIIVLFLILLFAIVFLVTRVIGARLNFAKDIFGQVKSVSNLIMEQSNNDSTDSINEQSNQIIGDVFNFFKNTQSEYDKQKEESEKRSFNLKFEINNGTVSGSRVQALLDDIIKSNQTNERKVTVKYNDTETTDVTEMRNLKRNFDNITERFEVYFEYDENGYIFEAFIEKI